MLRGIKESNDRIASNLAADSHLLIRSSLQAHHHAIEGAFAKLRRFIAHSDQHYLGPDLLRRTATLRQHLRIQADRRHHLLMRLGEQEAPRGDRGEAGEGGAEASSAAGEAGKSQTAV